MYSAVINVKTEPEIKERAQQIAKDIGVSLSGLLNAYLKQLIRTRKVEFNATEEPSRYLINAIAQARQDRKEGNASPIFDNAQDAVAWLENQGI